MSELDTLHADVLQHPEADAPRTAFAAAIRATDPARADLIEVQLQIAQLRRKAAPLLELSDGYTRERVLLERHKAVWVKPVTDIPGVTWVGLLRGFVEHVELTAKAFLDAGERLYSVAPVLHLDLHEVQPHAHQLFRSPLLGRIHSLSLRRQGLGDQETAALAASPHLSELRWLDLASNQIGPAGVEAMCASTGLPALRFVNFGDNPCPDPTPQIGETDAFTNEIVRLDIPPVARELEARCGTRRWLSYEMVGLMFPPGRDLF